jgi:hypothetical protein
LHMRIVELRQREWRLCRNLVVLAVVCALAIGPAGCQRPAADDDAGTPRGKPSIDEQIHSPDRKETLEGIDRAEERWGSKSASEKPKQDAPMKETPKRETSKQETKP